MYVGLIIWHSSIYVVKQSDTKKWGDENTCILCSSVTCILYNVIEIKYLTGNKFL